MRDNVTTLTFSGAPKPLARMRRARSRAPELSAGRVDPAALEVALTLAGGVRSRLRFNADGSIMVMNAPRLTRPRTPVDRGSR